MTASIAPALLNQLFHSTGFAALLTSLERVLGAEKLTSRTMTASGLTALVAELAPQLSAEQFILEEGGTRYTYTTLQTLAGEVIAYYEQVDSEEQMEAVSAAYLADARTAANA